MKDSRFIFLKFPMDSLAPVHDSSFPAPSSQFASTVTPGKALKISKELLNCCSSFTLRTKPDKKNAN